MKQSILLVIVFSIVNLSLIAQQNISGIINSYHEVSAINTSTQSVVLSNSSAITSGELVLLIQMKGAKIDESLSTDFGTIQSYNGSGNYELHRVNSKENNELFFYNSILNAYDTSGLVQVIKVPEYDSGAVIKGVVEGNAWDGKTGGVLALKVTGTLDLDTFNLTMDGKGFRGGQAILSGGGCLFFNATSEYTSINSGNDRALKGEGIAEYILNKECSRGPQANGGGGGNNHNGGGGGGANYGIGGSGGQRVKYTTLACGSVVGLDSKSLSSAYSQSKVFLGGGGGAGHGNNAGLIGESGENGGGIILVIADTIIGDSAKITANGKSGSENSENEGAGGAGAGGSILFQVNHFANMIFSEAYGGVGASVENFPNTNCSGAGGGGGGGVIAISQSSLSSNLSVKTNGGKSGVVAKSTQTSCPVGSTNGAKDGGNGTTLLSYKIPDQSFINVGLEANSNLYQIHVFPNPSDGVFTVTLPSSTSNYEGKVYSLSGNLVKQFEGENSKSVDINIQEKGIYILEMKVDNKVSYKRIIKN